MTIEIDCNEGFGFIVNTVDLYNQFITYQFEDYFENFDNEVDDEQESFR